MTNLIPHPGDTGSGSATPGAPWWWNVLQFGLDLADRVPAGMWVALLAGQLILTVILAAIAAARKNKTTSKTGDRLFNAAIGAALAFWVTVLIGSVRGLAAFGRDSLGWKNGWEYVVPATLDGVAIACALLVVVAVKRNRDATLAYRVVWVATLASAGINFAHETHRAGGELTGGAYLALLSIISMLLLHIIIALVADNAGPRVVRVRPVFGLRWVTMPTNTLCAMLAWTNYPPRPLPADATDDQAAWYASVRHAVAHLETVRRAKRIARYTVAAPAGAVPAVGWARILPWVRVRQLDAALTDLRTASDTAMTNLRAATAAEVAAARRETTDALTRLAEVTELFEVASAEAQQATTALAESEQARQAAETTATVATREVETRTAQLAELTADRDRVRAALDAAKASLRAATESAAEQSDLASRTAGQLAEARAVADRATRHAADLEQQMVAAGVEIDRLTGELETATATVARLRQRVEIAPRQRAARSTPTARKPAAPARVEMPAVSPADLPTIPKVAPATVARVLAAQAQDPDAGRDQVAEMAGVSRKTVQTVINNLPDGYRLPA